nr:hypothetical protein [Nocardia aurantiaca]
MFEELTGVFQVYPPLFGLGEFRGDHLGSPWSILLKFSEISQGQPGALTFPQQSDSLHRILRIASLAAVPLGFRQQAVAFPEADGRCGHPGEFGEPPDSHEHAHFFPMVSALDLNLSSRRSSSGADNGTEDHGHIGRAQAHEPVVALAAGRGASLGGVIDSPAMPRIPVSQYHSIDGDTV